MFEIGNSLKEARLRQQLDFPQVEQATKIRGKYLRALEDEQFEILPSKTYIKGFLRSYAEYLGLDGQLYVDEYNSRYVSGDEETPLRAGHTVRQRRERRLESRIVAYALAGIALAAALVFVAWKYGTSSSQTLPAPRSTPLVATPRPKPHLVVAGIGAGSVVEVRVGSASGAPRFSGTVGAGQSERFPERRLWIRVETPRNVRVLVDGGQVRMPRRGPVAYVVTPGHVRRAPVS